MKGDTVLDYVEFQLTAPRTRCELYVSANGITEKLASGFLKPFLTNLKVAEDQIAQGCQSIRLEHPGISRSRSWFTKGTVERFVRFVSTPEVLERVKSVEDELAQLEQVRSIQASSLLMPEDAFLGPKSTFSVDDRTQMSESNGDSNNKHSYKVLDGAGEASKVELLRAMDVRLLALRQEQGSSFTRAVAAGFSTENMADLVAFSEHFGAERLRVACLHFISVLRKRNSESFDPSLRSPSFCFADTTTQLNIRGAEVSPLPMNNLHNDGHEVSQSSSSGIENTLSRCQVGMEVRRRWGPPENIRPQIFSGFPETDSPSHALSGDSSHGESIHTTVHENGVPKTEPESLEVKPASSNQSVLRTHLPHDHFPGTYSADGSSQSIDQSAFDDHQSKGTNKYESMSSLDVEAGNDTSNEPIGFSIATVASTRRLSVQDAISLFENKQRRDSIDVPPKQRSGKGENNRASLEGNKAIPRRWSSFGGVEAKHNFQEQLMPFKQEVTLFSSGSSSASTPVASDGVTEVKQNNTETTSEFGDTVKPSSVETVSAQWKPSLQDSNLNPELVQHPVSDDSKTRSVDIDWRKQFKQQLERSLARDTSKSEKTTGLLSMKLGSLNKSREVLEEDRTSCQPTHAVSVLDKTLIKAPGDGYLNPKPKPLGSSSSSSSKSGESAVSIEENRKDISIADLRTGPNESRRKPPVSTSIQSFDNDMQALAKLVEYQTGDAESDDPSDSKGRFYEQYRKLRNAKLMEEHDAKRAEREAKLKSMEEALTKKKAEMDARVVRLSKNSINQARSMKLRSLRADLHTLKKDQGDAVVERSNSSSRVQGNSTATLISPPLTPQTGKEEPSTSKVQGPKKTGTTSVKAQNSRNSSKAGISVSPKITAKSTTAAMSIPRRAGTAIDNPLARSVPNFTNFRKENAKPSPARQLGSSARVHPKNGGSTRNRGEAIPSPLDANVVSSRTRSNVLTKDEKKQRSLMRKSCATVGDFKMLSNSTDDMVLAPLTKSQRDSSTYNKLRKSAIGSFQEVKPFLKKGSGIGAGVGTNAVKQKISNPSVDIVKTLDEESAPVCETNASNENIQFPESVNEVESMNAHLDVAVTEGFDSTSSNDAEMQVVGSEEDRSPGDSDNPDLANNFQEQGPWSDDTFDNDRNCHTISLPVGFQVHKQYKGEFPSESDENVCLRQDSILDENQASATIRANSLPHEHSMRISSPNITSPIQHGHCSSPRAISLESPVGSPASWNLSQVHYGSIGADAVQTNNKWPTSQKVTSSSTQSKEPAKGLKRLLKFGRKSRASDLAGTAAECVSASTISEGDDESEDHSRLSDEANRGKVQEKRNMIDLAGEQYSFTHDQGSFQSGRSSIPIPPANFRLRDDHLAGGTMLKAPRSFFSLTSFRSKGTEGKTR